MAIEKPSFTRRPDLFLPEAENELASQYINRQRIRRRERMGIYSHPPMKRPLPRDANVPEGFERNENGMIRPEKPPSHGLRHAGQRSDETQEEYLIRRKKESWNLNMIFASLVLLLVNIITAAFMVSGVDLPFPFGVIPLPFVIWAYAMKSRTDSKYREMKRERETEEIMRQSINRIGTTTVRR